MDLPICIQDSPDYLAVIVAEPEEMMSVESMFALRRGFNAAGPEIMRLARSCGGKVLIEDALESVARYLEHRDADLAPAAHETIEHLRLCLLQPGLW